MKSYAEFLTQSLFIVLGLFLLLVLFRIQNDKSNALKAEHQSRATAAIESNDILAESVITEKTEKTEVAGLIGSSTTYRYFFIVKSESGNKTEIEVEHDLYINSDVGDTLIFYKGYVEAPRGFKKLYFEVIKNKN